VVALINRALQTWSERLAWDFGQALAPRFLLPDALVPLESAAVDVEAARLAVRVDALELVVALTARARRLDGSWASDHGVDVA
jgi:hypothetical protein